MRRRLSVVGVGIGVSVLALMGAALRNSAPAVGTVTLAAFPVGSGCQKYGDTWHDARATNVHVGTDILAPTGTPLYAVLDTTVMKIGTNTLGGNALHIKQPDGSYFYYAHLSRYADGLTVGQSLKAGQLVGYVGDTGDAKGTPHLHFEVHPAWNNKDPVNPYPILRAVGGCGYTPAVVDGRPTDYNTGTPPTTTGTPGTTVLPRVGVPGGLTPITPSRLVDTRNAGGPYARLTAHVENYVTLAGRAGVGSGATMVAVNLTVASPSGDGWLAARPCGQAKSVTSSVNYRVGDTVATGLLVGLGTNGRVCFEASTDVDLIVDVTGSVSSAGALGFVPGTPNRVLDTRSGRRPDAGVTTVVSIPGSGVQAASLNITAVEPVAAGFLTVWPCGTDRPLASTLNVSAGDIIANAATVGVGGSGTVCVWSSVATHVVVDVAGIWQSAASGLPTPINPARLLDSRTVSSTRIAAGTVRKIDVGGRGGVPANASGVLLTATVTSPLDAGFLTVFPCGAVTPTVSNLNFVAGQTVSNSVTVGLGTGQVCAYSNVAIHLVVDATGYLS